MNSIFEWLGYFFRSKHRRGFGVHSPFAFYLVTKVIEEQFPYYKYELIEKVRAALDKTKKQLQVRNEATGQLEVRKISVESKRNAKLPSYDQLLFRLVNHSKSKCLLELKASFGISSMYMAAPDSKSQVWTMEEGETAKYARLSYEHAGFSNVHLEEGSCLDCLDRVLQKMDRIDFLFFNPNMRLYNFSQLSEMYAKCSQKMHGRSVAVIDAIHQSPAAKALWDQLKADDKVRMTMDVFSFGIIYYNTDLQKEDYVLRYFPSIKCCFL